MPSAVIPLDSQGACPVSEHVDARQLNRQRREIGDVQFVHEMAPTIGPHPLGRWPGNDVDWKAGVGQRQAAEWEEQEGNSERNP